MSAKKAKAIPDRAQETMLPDAKNQLVGIFRKHARGFGFVIPAEPSDHGELFIPPGAGGDALTGDTVVARIIVRRRQGPAARSEGEIVSILERGNSQFVGQLIHQGRDWMVAPEGKVLHVPILVGDVKATRARAGDQVVVEITEFPSEDQPARGVIVEVLGRHGEPEIDTLSMIRQYHLRDEFPAEVLEETRHTIDRYDLEAELAQREDLRTEIIVTIDPDDARDFDDAISVRDLGRGACELGVHIADVSTLVQPDTQLDTEAALRGNSIYFPRHVVPMLPELLSNGLCSLQEDQPRLAKSAFITYDAKGKRTGSRFANTVIWSNKRLTYQDATKILAGQGDDFDSEVTKLVNRMDKLARRIQKRRLVDGMVVLDLPEVELVLDDQDAVVDVEPTDTAFSHTIIEMFMVEANEAVAELMTRLKVPHLRRIHPDPPAEAQTKLGQFLGILGRPVVGELDRETMRRLLAAVKGKPDAFAVNLAVLRSMAQAEYSPDMVGHFALASKHYAHFTSPIRRYPDLVIHRLLDLYLRGKLKRPADRAAAPDRETLAQIGAHCSYTERQAEAAERELKRIKILRLLEKRIGEENAGVVTGVTKLGLFVQLERYLVDGLVRFRDLPDDWWDIDTQAGCVFGRQRGIRIGIGDRLTVLINRVDVTARDLDLIVLPEGLPKRRSKRATTTPGKPASRSANSSKRQAPAKRKTGSSAGSGPRRRRRR